ncbi:JNK-interacting protein 3-like isoform X3 [Daphnia pulex]|uniref:JNK-interacting protein 3-like isoform X3 n=1 Tax=Daphnia pulex TaxID=6669 RepID=UPI001EDDFC8F|nr:JNK-interacting protein 3-like isoform X3 [Daphnia pulex]
MEGETLYGSEDSQSVMSERVQTLARNIYQEFQRMIQKYDEDVVKDLMPNIVNMLECLDLAYTANQEHEVELELLREDNEQLVTQYEREKQLRRTTDSKLLELEDVTEEENKGLQAKVESLESIVRMLELKAKNATDHVFRLEEKENEMRKEFTKVHDRYTELLKVHMDHVERTRGLLGTDRLEGAGLSSRQSGMQSWNLNVNLTPPHQIIRSTGPLSFGFISLENAVLTPGNSKFFSNPVADLASSINTTPSSLSQPNALQTEMDMHSELEMSGDVSGFEQNGTMDQRDVWSSSSEKKNSNVLKKFDEAISSPHHEGKSLKRKEERSSNTLYQELSFQESSILEDSSEITGNWVHPGEFASSDSEPELEDHVEDVDVRRKKVTDNFYGMGKEVENLISENNELLATKNALNIVKDDLIAKVDELSSEQEILRDEIRSLHSMRTRLRLRTDELEAEVKALREEIENARKAAKSEEEEDVPLSQRKRFTRVEMARVLMERNQYKERWMELQEAVRWTEMLRAQKAAGQQEETDKRQKQSVWKFFSNLFNAGNERELGQHPTTLLRQSQTVPSLQFHAQSGKVGPGSPVRFGSDPARPPRRKDNVLNSDRPDAPGVRAHVRRQDGRLQAYGWSLPSRQPVPPAIGSAPMASGTPPATPPKGVSIASTTVGVPVPVYCRPLEDQEPGMKIWCAAGIDLTGGQTKDGGSMVGSSVFYNPLPGDSGPTALHIGDEISDDANKSDAIQTLAAELAESQWEREDAEMWERRLSSLVWIINSATGESCKSRVNVIDSNRPGDVILTFDIHAANVLCIATVAGVKDNDFGPPKETVPPTSSTDAKGADDDDDDNNIIGDEEPTSMRSDGDGSSSKGDAIIGSIRFVSCSVAGSDPLDNPKENDEVFQPTLSKRMVSVEGEAAISEPEQPASRNRTFRNTWNIPPWSDVIKDGLSESSENFGPVSTALATVWMGCQCGRLYIHSAVLHWKKPLRVIKLPDAVLAIIHVRGRVLAALANGQVAIFARSATDGEWDLSAYWLLELAPPTVAVRCLTRVHSTVWAAFRNKIAVIDPESLRVETCFEAHPRKESQIRQLCWAGDGVWISIRLDSSIRLFHAHDFRHLQDVDVEPYVSKMLGTGKLGFSFVRITSMMISLQRLWMGTGNGVIISVPLSESSGASGKPVVIKDILSSLNHNQSAAINAPASMGGEEPTSQPPSSASVYSDPRDRVVAGSFIPYCSMAQAQLSFHGHKDAVKFFVAVPGQGGASAASCEVAQPSEQGSTMSAPSPTSMLVLSGGEGYVDFRQGQDDDEDYRGLSHGETSHIIVWQVHC